MSEWFKEHAWKACERATVPEVRILSLPPKCRQGSLLAWRHFEGSTEEEFPLASFLHILIQY